MSSNLNLVGSPSISRRDITRKITGSAVYSYDINPVHIGLPSNNTPQDTYMLYMGLIRCPYPRANILSIDTSKAEAAGYVTLTADDLPPYTYWGTAGRQYTPLPKAGRDPVLFSGQPVAAVAAPSPDLVEDAAALVDVKYEVLPFVMDAEEALQPNAPQLFPGGPNNAVGGFTFETGPVPAAIHWERGDVSSALSSAAATIGYPVPIRIDTQLEQHYEFEPYVHVAMWENLNAPNNVTALPTSATGLPTTASSTVLRLWGDTQYAHADKSSIAAYFGIPTNNVIVSNALGGVEGGGVLGMGLGDKTGQPAMPLVAAMARKAGMAVKLALTRSDHEIGMSHRFPIRAYVSLGAASDGTFTAMKIIMYVNVGAYGGSNGSDAVSDFLNAYDVPNVLIDVYSVNTNAYRVAGPMRDVGESQGHFIMETSVDQLAKALNMDPLQFRLKNGRTRANAVDPTSINPADPSQQTGNPYTGWGMPEALIEPANQFNWNSVWQGWGKVNLQGTQLIGVGHALFNAAKGAVSPPSTAQIQLNSDGSITAFTGLTDHGAGGNTTFAIMAAEAVGLTQAQFGSVKLVQQDTSMTTDSGVTAGSRSTRTAGMAFLAAATNLASQLFPVVAPKMPTPVSDPNQLQWYQGGIAQIRNTSNSITLAQAAAFYAAANKGALAKGFGSYVPPNGIAQRVGGGKFFKVAVDIETAEVQILNYTAGMDIGKVIFYNGAMSQASGGLFMGLGESLFQERWNDPTTGQNINPNFHDFRIPTIMEIPQDVIANGPAPYMNGTNYKWVEYIDPVGPYGGKGIGENCLIGVSAALANALSNAFGGYQFSQLPISKEDIVAAIQWARNQGLIPKS
jgi:CO/xanthine dehydrogenase Mo-binding subunit